MGPRNGKPEDQWTFPDVVLTEEERREVLANVVYIGVITMFNTHLYTFGDKVFLQKVGGPIGLRATCAVARVTMLAWDVAWLARLKLNAIRLELGARYMDDLRALLYRIKRGWRWFEEELCWCKEWEQEDEEAGQGDLERTISILKGTMTEVSSFGYLRMTMESALDFADQRLPTLDTSIWVDEQNRVLYT